MPSGSCINTPGELRGPGYFFESQNSGSEARRPEKRLQYAELSQSRQRIVVWDLFSEPLLKRGSGEIIWELCYSNSMGR